MFWQYQILPVCSFALKSTLQVVKSRIACNNQTKFKPKIEISKTVKVRYEIHFVIIDRKLVMHTDADFIYAY